MMKIMDIKLAEKSENADIKILFSDVVSSLDNMKIKRKPFSVEYVSLALAIESLRKEMPMKPREYNSMPHHRCTRCGKAIRVFEEDPYNPRCQWCGQLIDWSDGGETD